MGAYEQYLKKYASQRGITEAEAERHALVQAVKAYYSEKKIKEHGE